MRKRFADCLKSNPLARQRFFCLSIGLLVFFLYGCAAPTRNPVPKNMVTQVHPLQQESIRVFIDPWEPAQTKRILTDFVSPVLDQHSMSGKEIIMLALSGGGDSGAFGAGILYGWSESGNRPEFDIVTGISTGALMSPFAFLGSDFDESLKAVYTEISAENIYEARSLGQMISRRDALADSKPLAELLKKHIDTKVLEKIAVAHTNGRRLFVGTTHLDSAQLVVWDMGKIAISEHPNALQLFRDILLASASIPIAFPPVYISVEGDGKQYDEMHVDGGLINQVFGIETLAHNLALRNASGEEIKARTFMIRNSDIRMEWQPMPKELISIANRTVDTMINSQSLGDIYRSYVLAQMSGIEFYLTGIPLSFDAGHDGVFDKVYMNELFNFARRMGKENNHWETELLGLKAFKNTE